MAWLLADIQLPTRDRKLSLVLYMPDIDTNTFWEVVKSVNENQG